MRLITRRPGARQHPSQSTRRDTSNARQPSAPAPGAERKEQRCAPRHTCCTDMQLVYENFPRQIDVRAPDISPHGMFINTPQAFDVGSRVRVRFRLGGSGRFIHAGAEVRYCLAGVGIGIEFVDIRPGDRNAIAEETCNCTPDW